MKFIILLFFTSCVSDFGMTVVHDKKQPPDGGILHVAVIKGNEKATLENHDKAYKQAQEWCEPRTVQPIVDDFIDMKKDRHKLLQQEEFIFEWICA